MPRKADDQSESVGVLAAAVRLIFGFTLVSRVLGLAREILTARLFGDTALGSAFATAFEVPNLFRRLFGEGALSAAFMPRYAEASRDSPGVAPALASVVVAALTLVTGGLLVLAELVLLAVLLLAEPGPDQALSVRLIMVMLPFMPLVCVTAILGGMLQVHGRFGPPAAAPILLNLFMIAGALSHFVLGLDRVTSAHVVGVCAVAAGVAQVAWSLSALRGLIRWTRDVAPARDAARTVLRRFGPVVIGLGTLQLSTLIDTVIAMWPVWVGPTMFGRPVPLDEASKTILSTTSRFYQFPLGVFGIAVATAVFPLLSRAAGDGPAFVDTLRRGVRLSLFIGLPASVGLALIADDLIRVMLGGGTHSFSEDGLKRSASVLLAFAPAVWAFSVNQVLTRAFYAKGDTVTPMKLSLAALVLGLALNLALIWPFREAGLAWATSISAVAQTTALSWLASRRFGPGVWDGASIGGMAKAALASGVMGLAVAGVDAAWAATSWAGLASEVAACTAVGGAVYALAAVALRMPELRWLFARGPAGGLSSLPME